MSRYHPVKPRKGKKKKQRQQNTEPQPEEMSYEERYRMSVKKTADEIYQQRYGDSIDAAIRRAERTLELYDKDLENQDQDNDSQRRWKITPTASLQWQRELERQQKRKDELYKECWAMARQMVDEWMQADAQQKADARQKAAATPPAPGAEDFHGAETQPTVNFGRGQADAGQSAA
jgi:hypothetical protein